MRIKLWRRVVEKRDGSAWIFHELHSSLQLWVQTRENKMLLLNKHMSVLINQNVPAGPRDGGGGLWESSQSFASMSKHKERKKEKNSRLNSRFPSVATQGAKYILSAQRNALMGLIQRHWREWMKRRDEGRKRDEDLREQRCDWTRPQQTADEVAAPRCFIAQVAPPPPHPQPPTPPCACQSDLTVSPPGTRNSVILSVSQPVVIAVRTNSRWTVTVCSLGGAEWEGAGGRARVSSKTQHSSTWTHRRLVTRWHVSPVRVCAVQLSDSEMNDSPTLAGFPLQFCQTQ